MAHITMVTDSFDGGRKSQVLRIGNAFLFDCDRLNGADERAMRDLASVRDWRDDSKPKTTARLRDMFMALGLVYETRFDAVHGRRYKLCVYPADNAACRRVTLAASDDMSDTDPFAALSIRWELVA